MQQHDREHWIYGVARWVEDRWIETAEVVWPMVFAAVSLWFNDEFRRMLSGSFGLMSLAVAIPLVFIGGQFWIVMASRKKQDRMSILRKEMTDQDIRHRKELQEQREQCADRLSTLQSKYDYLQSLREARALQVTPFIHSYLEHFGLTQLSFGAKAHEYERLTVFLHDEANQAFHPICRCSSGARFETCGRSDYPDSQGCLGKVWEHGFYCSNNYPNPAHIASYIEHSAKDGFPKELVQSMGMKARVYCGTVIRSDETKAPIGVLLFEATVDQLGSNTLRDRIKKEERGHLGRLIDARD